MIGRSVSILAFVAAPAVLVAACDRSPTIPAPVPAQEGLEPANEPTLDVIPRKTHDPLAGGSGGITVPTTGTSDDGGTFRGTLTVTGATFDPEIGPVLLGRIHGSLAPGSQEEERGPTENLILSFVEWNYDAHVDTDKDCIWLEISPGSVFDSETKRTIEIETVRIMSHRLPGPANLIADLICAVDRAIEAGWKVEEQEAPQ